MKTEIEVKLRLAGGPAETRRLLEARGAHLVTEREFEDNVLFDNAALSLLRGGRMLRLRRCRPGYPGAPGIGVAPMSAGLTLKEMGESTSDQYKIRTELETSLDDPEAFEAILDRLGLRPVYRYQKYRTTFEAATAAGPVEVMLDETPIGAYLELEGPPAAIDEFAAKLGFSPADYITLSYRALQEQASIGTGRATGDMIFEDD